MESAAEERVARRRAADREGLPPVADLARGAREGDRSAFHALYERTSPLVHAVLLSRVPAADADDLVQDVFLQAWRRLASLRDESRVGPWLATIARNLATRRHARGPRPTEPLPEETDEPAAEAPARADAEASRAALACLCELPETYREVLALRFVEGLTGPEIARGLGRSPETVRVQLARGTKLLRERLATRGWS